MRTVKLRIIPQNKIKCKHLKTKYLDLASHQNILRNVKYLTKIWKTKTRTDFHHSCSLYKHYVKQLNLSEPVSDHVH